MKGFFSLLDEYKDFLTGCGFAERTCRARIYAVKDFYEFLKTKGNEDLRNVSDKDILLYREEMRKRKTEQYKMPYRETTISGRLFYIKVFFHFLYVHEHILSDPFENLDLVLSKDHKPRGVFTKDEINIILDSIDINETFGKRNRALYELIYASGLRSSEASNLDISDIDMRERILIVRQGKGRKDRYVPFSLVALKFLKLYMDTDRKRLLKSRKDEKSLFLTKYGRMTPFSIYSRFMKILKKTGIEKKNRTLHSIRHSTATHLLEAGADVRYVAELLGHEDIETTVKYTHLLTDNLKRAYKSAHPRENRFYEEITEKYLQEVDNLRKELTK